MQMRFGHKASVSLCRLKMNNRGTFIFLIISKFLEVKCITSVNKVKNTNKKLKVNAEVFGSQENRSLLWLEVRLTEHN